jgi:hypothetical protein
MRLPRKHIPLPVRVIVARRQLSGLLPERVNGESVGAYLDRLLFTLAANLRCQPCDLRLDHDPALSIREKVFACADGSVRQAVIVPEGATVLRYIPDELDPEFMAYRDVENHDVKTRMRGDHGQYSDLVLLMRERRRAKQDTRPRYRWASRKIRPRNNLRKNP